MGADRQDTGNGDTKADYYNSGSTEPATDTPLTLNRLETRRKLTKNNNRLVIVLVGLPARGKSFVARKLLNFLEWYGSECKIFNVGKYRRQAYLEMTNDTTCDADFFDSKNKAATELRMRAASVALRDMLRWLDEEEGESDDEKEDSSRRSFGSGGAFAQEPADRIAIFDATNSTQERRKWILEQCTSPLKRPGKPTGCVFVESLCDDEELLMENYLFKISHSPDYKGMSEEEAMADLRKRVSKYEEQYETITDDSMSYIKIFNLSTKLLVNHIYGRMAKIILPSLMAWNIGTKPIFLCRPGQTLSDVGTDDDEPLYSLKLTERVYADTPAGARRRLVRGDSLGPSGRQFSEALYDLMHDEGMKFAQKRESMMDMTGTGTSISGLAGVLELSAEPGAGKAPFPLKILTSTMPRAVETVRWEGYDFKVEEYSNLNPLDKGDFVGKELEEVKETDPSWYGKLERNPFTTRFPGGESYKDLIRRLESMVVDLEQQVIPTLVVSHVSVLQVLMAYFRRSPISECMNIDVPLHTVVKFTPVRGGGWSETRIQLAPSYNTSESNDDDHIEFEGLDKVSSSLGSAPPIWGDHMRRASSNSTGGDKK